MNKLIKQRAKKEFIQKLLISLSSAIIWVLALFYNSDQLEFIIKQESTNTFLLGFTLVPFLMGQAYTQVVGKYFHGYFHDLMNSGILGQHKLNVISLLIGMIAAGLCPLIIYANNTFNIKIFLLIIDTIIASSIISALVILNSEKGICDGSSWFILIQAVYLTIKSILKLKAFSWTVLFLGFLTFIFLFYLQTKNYQIRIKNLSTRQNQNQNGILPLPFNTSNIVPLIFALILNQFLHLNNILLQYIIVTVCLLILNYFYSTIMIDPVLISEEMQKRDSYILKNNDIIQAGQSTINYLRKIIHRLALSFSGYLVFLMFISYLFDYLLKTNNIGISLMLNLMLIAMMIYQIKDDFNKYLLLLRS